MSTTSPKVAAHPSKCSMPLADGWPGGEDDAVAGVLLPQVPRLHEQVESSLAAAGLDAGDTLHLRRNFQIFSGLALVKENLVDTQLVEDQAIVLLVLGLQVFEPLFPAGLLFFDGLDDVAAGRGLVDQ
jgi:hypothetical protein